MLKKDTLLDDFIISLRVAQEGYTIQYDPEAYAIEAAHEKA
jgi:cellulose synthase/poly-beta-1,6-N-acetylglucosamine synthase-like glycosyltransferase